MNMNELMAMLGKPEPERAMTQAALVNKMTREIYKSLVIVSVATNNGRIKHDEIKDEAMRAFLFHTGLRLNSFSETLKDMGYDDTAAAILKGNTKAALWIGSFLESHNSKFDKSKEIDGIIQRAMAYEKASVKETEAETVQ
jgi:hypothetical protein